MQQEIERTDYIGVVATRCPELGGKEVRRPKIRVNNTGRALSNGLGKSARAGGEHMWPVPCARALSTTTQRVHGRLRAVTSLMTLSYQRPP